MPGFGFMRYPQRPAPAAEDVGAALMQQGAQQPAAAAAPMLAAPPPDPLTTAQMLRSQGAAKMGAAEQLDDAAGPDTGRHSANALNVAVGEALTRMGGGYQTNPNPHKPRERSRQTLQQLGLSAEEAELLIRTGGV